MSILPRWAASLLAAPVLLVGIPAQIVLAQDGRPVFASAEGERHADPDLEALLPRRSAARSLTVESQAGTDLATNSAAFDAFLAGLGKTRADFSLASAYAAKAFKAAVGALAGRRAPILR